MKEGIVLYGIPVIPVQRQCLFMLLAVGIQGLKAYGLCKTPMC